MDPTSESLAQMRLRQQEALADLGQLAADADPDRVLREAAGTVADAVQADYCAVLELRPTANEAVLRQGAGWRDGAVGNATVSTETNSLSATTLRSDEPIVVDEIGDDRVSGHELLASHDITSAVGVRIGTADEPWGVLWACADEPREFADHEAAFLRRAADVLASAVDRAEREREWRRKERRYEAIFEDPNILVGLLAPDGTVLDINGTAMEYIDASLADVTGEPFWETPWWGGGDGVQADVREWVERAANGEYVDFEADLTRPDGERYTLSGSFRPVTDDDGEVVSIIVSDKDVTERKARERALEESERRYRTLVEHFPNGAVALVDEDLTYRTVGGRPLDVAGVTTDEVQGQPADAVLPEKLAAELVPRYEAAFDGESSTFEIELDGRIFQFQVVPVRDDDGDVFTALGMSQDVTEREEVKRKLAESERRYRTLVENVPNGSVGLFDENLEYMAVGGQLLESLDMDPDDRIGSTITELHPDEIVDQIEPYFRAALDGESDSFEIEYQSRHLDAHTLPIRDAEGEVDAGMLVVRDVTARREYERKLERYREYTDHILNAIDDVFYVLNADGTLQRWNESVREVTGYTDAELSSIEALDLFDDDEHETIAAAISEVFETGSSQAEAELRTKDGERIPYEFSASRLEDPDGNPVLAGIGRDITERKARERALEESEAKFRMLAENLDELVWISDPDTREIRYLNPAYEEIWGRDRQSVYDDPTTFLEAVHPDDRERVERAYAAVPDEDFDEEYRIVQPDGDVRWVSARSGRVRTDARDRVIGIAEDITERKKRERALEESERRYRTLVENFPDGAVGLFDENLEYTAVGGQLLEETGVSAADRIGDSVYDIYPDELVAEIEGHFQAALEGEANSFEVEYHDRSLHAHTLPVRNADGDVFAGMLVVQDVTERREYERKLKASNERLEQFAYAASHDLQEPLRMVSSYLQLIEQRYGDDLDGEGREFLEFAVDGADRMRDMIEGLLTYSRVDTRAGSFEPVDLDEVLEDVRQDLAVKIEETDAEITAEELPTVYGDGGQLTQVFQNLLSNAMEYSGDEPPRIHVSAERRGDEYVISVADEGIGIDPDDADRVFEVFQRLHTQDEHSGTGIGLALCDRIVERHGGDIWVDSAPGDGATFSFTLPAT